MAGDFKKGERILDWLINQKDPSLDRIEEVDGGTLRKLIDTADHLAVYFCKFPPKPVVALCKLPQQTTAI